MADPREDKIAELTAVIGRLIEENARLRKENARLRERVAELEEKLGENSSNSSKPPSSDPIGKNAGQKKRRRKNQANRRAGGQPGHQGAYRPLVENPERIVPVKPSQCFRCGLKLKGDDPQPSRHQVTELPPIRAEVTEYQMHTLVCSCGARNCAQLPAGVSPSSFGPRLTARIALLTGEYRLSRRMAQQLLLDLYEVEISCGSIVAAEQRVSGTLQAPCDDLHEYIQEQKFLHVDETGWRERGKRAYLWVARAALATFYLIRPSRCHLSAHDLIQYFTQVLICDRYAVYDAWLDEWKQYCWAHLSRTFQKMAERKGESGRIGSALLREVRLIFRCWHRARDGTISTEVFKNRMGRIRGRVARLLEDGTLCGHTKTAGTCRKLLEHFRSLWTFVDHPEVPPTNNAGEQALRRGVIWRKTSFGTWSPKGSRFVERMLTVCATLRQQRRNVLDFLTKAYQAALERRPPPSLRPTSTEIG